MYSGIIWRKIGVFLSPQRFMCANYPWNEVHYVFEISSSILDVNGLVESLTQGEAIGEKFIQKIMPISKIDKPTTRSRYDV